MHTEALAIDREIGSRRGEGLDRSNLGLCYFGLGEYRRAIDWHTQALAIARDIGHRYLEASALDSMGRASLAAGDARQAVALLGQAVSIADDTGDIEPAVEARSWLARAHLQLGDAAAALVVTAVQRELTYPLEEPATHLLEGLALLELNRADESALAFREALAAAGGLLALEDRNVAALEARALALSGLAVVAADPARAAEAAEAFTRARSITTAHDHSGILAALDPD